MGQQDETKTRRNWTQFVFQGTWAGIDPVVRALDPSREDPDFILCRMASPNFAQNMAEYLIAQVTLEILDRETGALTYKIKSAKIFGILDKF